MPIFCFVVNFVYGEKLVPITRRIGTSIGPVAVTIALEWMDERSENGPFWERCALYALALHR